MAVTFPWTFANLSGSVPASDLDDNFQWTTVLANVVPAASTLTGSEKVLIYQTSTGAVYTTLTNFASTIGVGLAAQAVILQTGRTISATGDLTWTSGSFNGSANVTGVATVLSASTTQAGKIQVATSAQAITGSSTNLALAPGTLTGASYQSKSANGFATLPGGVIIQWGQTAAISQNSGATTITFPKTFTTAVYSITATPLNAVPDTGGTGDQIAQIVSMSGTASFTILLQGVSSSSTAYPINWIAIGV